MININKDFSFDKDLNFNTRVSSIVTIELEDNLEVLDNSIEGSLLISGKYKILDASTILEDFSFDVPCTISILDTLDPKTVNYSITNFTYEIIDNSILRCHISMNINGDELVRECDDDIVPDELKEIPIKEDRVEEKEEKKEESKGEILDTKDDDKKLDIQNSLFANLEDNGFTTYHVYIMREGDTIDKVISKYKSSKDELSLYNDLSSITVNSKVIVPSNE